MLLAVQTDIVGEGYWVTERKHIVQGGMTVKMYNDCKFLSKLKEDAEVSIIADRGYVEEGELDDDDSVLLDAVDRSDELGQKMLQV